jgi:Flp pilus assembly protein TadD
MGGAAGHLDRGVALKKLGRNSAALESFNQAIVVNPQLAAAHSNRE